MVPSYGWGLSASRLQSHYEGSVYFLRLSPQELLVLIALTCVSEPGTFGLRIQSPNHPYNKCFFTMYGIILPFAETIALSLTRTNFHFVVMKYYL